MAEVAAEVVSGQCYTTFANCTDVDKVLGSLAAAFDPTPLRAGRDQVQLREVTPALGDRS